MGKVLVELSSKMDVICTSSILSLWDAKTGRISGMNGHCFKRTYITDATARISHNVYKIAFDGSHNVAS